MGKAKYTSDKKEKFNPNIAPEDRINRVIQRGIQIKELDKEIAKLSVLKGENNGIRNIIEDKEKLRDDLIAQQNQSLERRG